VPVTTQGTLLTTLSLTQKEQKNPKNSHSEEKAKTTRNLHFEEETICFYNF